MDLKFWDDAHNWGIYLKWLVLDDMIDFKEKINMLVTNVRQNPYKAFPMLLDKKVKRIWTALNYKSRDYVEHDSDSVLCKCDILIYSTREIN